MFVSAVTIPERRVAIKSPPFFSISSSHHATTSFHAGSISTHIASAIPARAVPIPSHRLESNPLQSIAEIKVDTSSPICCQFTSERKVLIPSISPFKPFDRLSPASFQSIGPPSDANSAFTASASVAPAVVQSNSLIAVHRVVQMPLIPVPTASAS